MKLVAPGLDLRHVEHVVDKIEQMRPAGVDVAGIFAIARGAVGSVQTVADHLREPENGIEQCSQLVAHIGKEARLRLAGGLGAQLGGENLALGRLAQHGLFEHPHRQQTENEQDGDHADEQEQRLAAPGGKHDGFMLRYRQINGKGGKEAAGGDARLAIDRADDPRRHRLGGLAQKTTKGRIADRLAHHRLGVRMTSKQHAVAAEHRNGPAGAEVDRRVDPLVIERFERRERDAGEAAVGLGEAASDIDRPLVVDAIDCRHADDEALAGMVTQSHEIVAVADIDRRRRMPSREGDDTPGRINHDKRAHRRRAEYALAHGVVQALRETGIVEIVGRGGFGDGSQQDIDAVEGSRHQFGESDAEIAQLGLRHVEAALARLPAQNSGCGNDEDGKGDCGDDYDTALAPIAGPSESMPVSWSTQAASSSICGAISRY
jgi:hypothetical protein